ncbi:MAG: PQQ-binding-like beta-propeller repeat protein [candidate division Zixibacteria bacterium]
MKSLFPILSAVVIFLFSACTVPKKLKRNNGYFKPINEQKLGVYPSDGNLTGQLNLLYEYKIKGAPTDPIILGDRYLSVRTSRNRVVFYDQESGKRVCRIKQGRGFILPPLLTDSLIVYVKKSPLGQIRVQNLFTGKKIGELNVKDIRSGPIIVNNSLIVGTTTGLLSLNLTDLRREWRLKNDDVVDILPVYDGSQIYYAAGSGQVKAVEPGDGSLIWEIDCNASISSKLGIGRYLYIGLTDGDILAHDKNNGSVVWRTGIGYAYRGKAVEHNDRIYIGCTDGKVYCLSAEDGGIIWEYQTDGVVVASPVIHSHTVLIGSYDRNFYSLDAESGEMLDSHNLEGPVAFAAVINNNRIFVACQKNRIYCFEEH